ncbi:tRNA (adenosine(37)-N6)-threonylcarbamoyltransferase complex dimerization subunit type 1 TsaB [Pseudohaliea rubra]|uniref:tRNA threonylcarbamoyladenosine biosynthesis protein TsaB n=1 Tax=Pseudohaliea rubra DSM 19751 TaxID=1265313 RepID=A0A095XT72_9GAMM|nr:tRNA (adenosine(37)-N6)-threonylcarbamoyltransferase complex dimerization subunit type 1 TsaB [Pseudohaliea rubra]KGE02866.1 Inactive similar to metal-dependent protease, putative molecular chaperone [Pseudohaliea rubra DSM 19751]
MSDGPAVLAVETATDACSVALALGGELRSRHEVVPRQHQQRLFAMIHELAGSAPLAALGLDLIAYGRGPGSFTGLRIAAAAAQGLAFSLGLPIAGVPTLAIQAQTALRRGEAAPGSVILSTIDARIGELYWALYDCTDELPRALSEPAVCRPEALPVSRLAAEVASGRPLYLVGSGAAFADAMPAGLPAFAGSAPALLPEAEDLVPLARACLAAGEAGSAAGVAPLYVQGGDRWKTLAEQGRAR